MASVDDEHATSTEPADALFQGRGGVPYQRLTPAHHLPIHPVPAMQGAFEQSIMEAVDESLSGHARDTTDAVSRRKRMMEGDHLSDEYSSRWQRSPDTKWHPLWKLIAQISFGVHLLQQKLAKSDQEVIEIMQTHVDEVDAFVEDTMADFNLAIDDIKERIDFLSLPLDHGKTFDSMLKDTKFRNTILEGNEVIERIIERTRKAIQFALADIKEGTDATAELAKYLDRLITTQPYTEKEFTKIFVAMRGNTEGWWKCFKDLQRKSEKLKRLIAHLQGILLEVTRRAGIASRRKRRMHEKPSVTFSDSRSTTSLPQRNKSLNKPLPPDPMLEALALSVVSRDDKREEKPAPLKPSASTRIAPSVGRHSKPSRHLQSLSVTIEAPELESPHTEVPELETNVPTTPLAELPVPMDQLPINPPEITIAPPETEIPKAPAPPEFKFENPDSVAIVSSQPSSNSLRKASVANSEDAGASNSSSDHENDNERQINTPSPDSAYGSLLEDYASPTSGLDLSKANLALYAIQAPNGQLSCFSSQRKSAGNDTVSLTALPTFDQPSEPLLPASSPSKKAKQKQPFTGVKGLFFARKRSFKERRTVSGGLGGHTIY